MKVIVFFYTMSFNVYRVPEWVFQYRNTWNEIESQVFEKLTTEPTKGESKCRHGNLKLWTKHIRKIFYGQDASCGMYWNQAAGLKIDCVYRQCKNYHPHVYVEECKYVEAESQQ